MYYYITYMYLCTATKLVVVLSFLPQWLIGDVIVFGDRVYNQLPKILWTRSKLFQS